MNTLSAALGSAAQDHNRALVERLQRHIESSLAEHLPPGTRVALLGFPDYWNPGDSALWLGTLEVFGRLGVEVVHVASARNYRAEILRRRLGDGLVVLTGGGNFGDLWPGLQAFRERVLRDTVGQTVLQLPQSIHFRDPARLQRFKAIAEAHGDFRLLVRDELSLELARDQLGMSAGLCPDMAFGLGPLARPEGISCDVLWLKRDDREALERPALPAGEPAHGSLRVLDWASPDDQAESSLIGAAPQRRIARQIRRQHWWLDRQLSLQRGGGPLAGLAAWQLPRTCARLAQLRTQRGLRMVASGRTVITDRLHGHILCVLAGIPHLCLDNSYGKVSGCWQAWTHDTPVGVFADSEAQALAGLPSPPAGG